MQISEELDKVTGKTGAWNIALGIISIVGGIATGVLLLVHGGKLLRPLWSSGRWQNRKHRYFQ